MLKQLIVSCLLVTTIFLGACAKSSPVTEQSENETVVYESETGPVEVPKEPKRVILLSGFVGNLIQLETPIIGADKWSMANTNFKSGLKDATEVSEENLEQIASLKPDLIIALSTVKNLDKLKVIAPTVTYTWGKLNYLDQHIALGKLVGKEQKAREWVEDFKNKASETGELIRRKIGDHATVTVMGSYDKSLYVFGNNWARGTELLYQTMGLNMNANAKRDAIGPGYYAISAEVMPKYVGDYLVITKYDQSKNYFETTSVYQNMKAVKVGHVLEMSDEMTSFSDPITMAYLLKTFKTFFLGA